MISFGNKNAKAFRFGNKDAKKIEAKKNGTWQTVWTAEPAYDYGDGHLNTVTGGYNGTLYAYSAALGEGQEWQTTQSIYWDGNFMRIKTSNTPPYWQTDQSFPRVNGVLGTNTRALNVSAADDDVLVFFYVTYYDTATSLYLKDFSITVDGTAYTLQQAVAAGVIRPLVMILSSANGTTTGYADHYYPNILNLYSGGQTGNGKRAEMRIWIMLTKGHTLNSFSYWASAAAIGENSGNSVATCPAHTCRLLVSLPQ